VKGIEKFNAGGGRKGWLSPAEFVATARRKQSARRAVAKRWHRLKGTAATTKLVR